MRLEWDKPLQQTRESLRVARRAWRHFAPFVAHERRALIVAVLCGAGSAFMMLARPWPLKIVFDHVLGHRAYPGWLLPLKHLAPTRLVALVSIAYLLVVFLGGIFTYWQEILTARAGQKVVFGLRRKLFNHLLSLSLGFHRRRRSGDLLMHLTGDIQLLRDMIVDGAILVSSQTLVVVGMVVIATLLDPQLALLAMLVVPLIAVSSVRVSRGIRHAAKHQRKREGELAANASETLSAIAVVQAFGRERVHGESFAQRNSASLKQGLRTTRLEALLGRIADTSTAVGVCSVLYVGSLRAAAGIITPGDLIVFMHYLTIVYRPIRRVARVASRSAKAQVCSERLVDLLETDIKIKESKTAVEAPRFSGHITFDGVHYTYPQARKPALAGVSLEVEPGEIVALCGEIGAGKTTLASLLVRLIDADAGEVCIDGENVRKYTLESLRGRIAVVPQEPILFHASVHDNIAYGLTEASRELVQETARAVGADDFVNRLKDGYDTVLGERGGTLSSGQRQLLSLARALAKDSPLLILDEPTANLDAVSREVVRKALAVLLRGRTALFITHTLSEALAADRVAVLRQGELIELGTPRELTAAGGWFAEALQAQRAPLIPARERK